MANTIADGNYFIINARSAIDGYNASVNVWQYYSYDYDDYIYTTNYAEYKHAVYWHNYRADGIAFKLNGNDKAVAVHELVKDKTSKTLNNKPVYKNHQYVPESVVSGADSAHYQTLDWYKQHGWIDLGIAFYGNSGGVGHAPVYLEYLENDSRQLYWLGSYVDTSGGWQNFGIAFYAGGIFALDAKGNGQDDYTNVWAWWPEESDAQIWTVTTRRDGSKRIMNRASGKNLDVIGGFWNSGKGSYGYVNGQNVGLYHDWTWQQCRDSSVPNRGYAWNQAWTFTDTGKTANYQGTDYPIIQVGLFEGDMSVYQKGWILELYGEDNDEHMYPGVNVDVAQNGGVSDQGWIFVPVPNFIPNEGIYSIRPVWSDDMRLTCSGPPYVNGTNVFIHAENGSPNQYWAFFESNTAGKYKIRNLGGSAKYLDIDGREPDLKNNQNAQIWDYDGYTMDWRITRYEDLEVDGVMCPVVRIDVADSNGKYYCLDVSDALNENNRNVQAYENNNTGAQRWILFPEIGAAAGDVAVPTECYIDEHVEGYNYRNSIPYTTGVTRKSGKTLPACMIYPTWACTDAWFAGDNIYQFRYRSRYYAPRTGYTSWSDYTQWCVPSLSLVPSLNRAWLTDGIDSSWYTDQYIDKQYEFNVRCVGSSADATSKIVGGSAIWYSNIVLVPEYDFTEAGMSFDGLHLGFDMTYKASGNLFITGIYRSVAPNVNILYKEVDVTGIKNSSLYYGEGHNITIPLSNLRAAPKDGENLVITYQVGCITTSSSDSLYRVSGSYRDSIVEVKMEVGNVGAKPVVYACYRHAGFITLPDYPTCHLWYYHDDKVEELQEYTGTDVKKPNGKKMFMLSYPWGDKTVMLATSIQSADTTKWGSFYGEVDITSLDPSRVHLWMDDEKHLVCIDCREGSPLESKLNLESNATKVVLNDREHEMVTFDKTIKNSFQIEGAIMHSEEFGYTDCTTDEIKALVSTHQTYRNPRGDIMRVAVTGVSVVGHHDWDEVTVSMTEESI